MKLKKYLPTAIYEPVLKLYNVLINPYYQKSYAQEGEDLLLQRILYGKVDKGFYIDVGAHHPKRFSNTYFFYRKGWRGINIEPMPGSKRIFDKYRPKDINLEIPISSTEEELTYYMFNDPALNGFSEELSLRRNEMNEYKILKSVKMKTKTLYNILDMYLPVNQEIDLLSIDVEGLDLEVLKSNNWNKYRPYIMLVEDKEFNLENPKESLVYSYLSQLNYHLIANTLSTLIFERKRHHV